MEYASIYYVGPRARVAKKASVQGHPVKLQEEAERYAASIAQDLKCQPEDVTVAVVMDNGQQITPLRRPMDLLPTRSLGPCRRARRGRKQGKHRNRINTYRTMATKHTIPTPYNYDGQHCPNCGHDNITADAPELNDEEINRTAVCGNCGAKWIEVYSLIGYANLDDENGNEQEIPDDGKFGEVELKQQRDELLEALAVVFDALEDAESIVAIGRAAFDARFKIRAAIAKATGKQ